METNKEISKKVNGLIEKNNDAYKGFKQASENAESTSLRDFLMSQASQRKEFANNLSSELKTYNPEFEADEDGSATGSLHRTWMNVKAALSVDDDESILEECIRGDKASVDEYKDFLKDHNAVHSGISNSVNQQLHAIEETLSRVKRLEDLH